LASQRVWWVVGGLIGSGASQGQAIVGETPNLAARLQGIANPNGVVVSESTRKLVGNPFELQGLGGQDLKFSPWVIDVPVPVPRLPRANRTWIKAALLLYCTAVFLMTYTPWNVVFILAAFSLARSDALPQRMRIDPGAG
jgi:hypothetical protein